MSQRRNRYAAFSRIQCRPFRDEDGVFPDTRFCELESRRGLLRRVNAMDLSIMIPFYFMTPGPGQPDNLCE